MSDRGQLLVALSLVALGTQGCVDEHPAYELDFQAGQGKVAQTSDDPSALGVASVTIRVEPRAGHTESWVTLGASERFPEGLLRLYEPAENPRFRYDERKPVLAIPAELVGDRVRVQDEEVVLQLAGQVSNLELEPLCGEPVVYVPRIVSWETRPGEPGDRTFDPEMARNVRIAVDAKVECL